LLTSNLIVKYSIMLVNKVTEIIIYETPDGGQTVYARNPGSKDKWLHHRDPALIKEEIELEKQKKWVEIFAKRNKNEELNRLCEQVEIFYELSNTEL